MLTSITEFHNIVCHIEIFEAFIVMLPAQMMVISLNMVISSNDGNQPKNGHQLK